MIVDTASLELAAQVLRHYGYDTHATRVSRTLNNTEATWTGGAADAGRASGASKKANIDALNAFVTDIITALQRCIDTYENLGSRLLNG